MPTAGSAAPAGRARTLAQVYRRFGEVDAAGTSPLYERVAVALSGSDEALRAIGAAPARKRHPTRAVRRGPARPDTAACCIRPLPRRRIGWVRRRSPLLVHGDAVEVLPDAFARVPADALPVVTTTWALSRLRPQRHRPGGVRRVDAQGRGHRALLVAGPHAGLADRVPVSGGFEALPGVVRRTV
uniref:DUF2332 family protein n=1 Tax=Rhodococcus oryzae TaxID=2571143 RepID=UPI001FE2C48F|nr:DUF2332 family protein [Rhodococcus oryzae]